MEETKLKDTVLLGLSSQGIELRAQPVRLSRYLIVFEVLRDQVVLQTSEVLTEFRILIRDRLLYSGRAVVKNLVDTGLVLVCEAALEDSWQESELFSAEATPAQVNAEFTAFFSEWQKLYRVATPFKALVADLQMFLTDLRLWVDQAEVGVRAMPQGDRHQRERELAAWMGTAVFPVLDTMFDKLETMARDLEPSLRPAHEVYVRRQLHPLVLCSPFASRSVHKPLGYAGDYEMVNMILRDPHEGSSLFARVLNRWFIKQPPAEAHRNRVDYLFARLEEEGLRRRGLGAPCRVFNVGCGPAGEVQRFLASSQLADDVRMTLLDFNEETLQYTRQILEAAKREHRRPTSIEFVKKSVVQLLRGRSRAAAGPDQRPYDFVYCAGLFDYLPDLVCRQLISVFYDQVAPGGLVVVTNVDPSNPIRHWLAIVLDWHLIYRDARQLLSLVPKEIPAGNARVVADVTGVNVMLELRRPA